MDESELDGLEHYLANARVLDVSTFSQTTAHPSFRLILEGGVGVLAKPADTAPEGEIMCRREAAAWMIARALGWPDLMGATMLRWITSPTTGDEVATSVQVIWPDYHPDADPTIFSDEDVWRAAVFDAAIGHSDRGGHNWLAVPGSGTAPQLKLVDHGYGFPSQVSAPNSTFFAMRRRAGLPEEITEALVRFVERRTAHGRLHELLASDAEAVFTRAEALIAAGVLEIS